MSNVTSVTFGRNYKDAEAWKGGEPPPWDGPFTQVYPRTAKTEPDGTWSAPDDCDFRRLDVASIRKNDSEEIRIDLSRIDESKVRFIQVRIWENRNGAMRPTTKGITLSAAMLTALIDGLSKAKEEAVKEGWL